MRLNNPMQIPYCSSNAAVYDKRRDTSLGADLVCVRLLMLVQAAQS
jgi:hypothetical protein